MRLAWTQAVPLPIGSTTIDDRNEYIFQVHFLQTNRPSTYLKRVLVSVCCGADVLPLSSILFRESHFRDRLYCITEYAFSNQ